MALSPRVLCFQPGPWAGSHSLHCFQAFAAELFLGEVRLEESTDHGCGSQPAVGFSDFYEGVGFGDAMLPRSRGEHTGLEALDGVTPGTRPLVHVATSGLVASVFFLGFRWGFGHL